MTKQGLRSASGPFDWIISPFQAVIEMVANDFRGYLTRDNLVVTDDTYPDKIFADIRYGFTFTHDLHDDLDEEYPHIYEKYQRRIQRFYQDIKSPTLFFRAIHNQNEVTYINDNYLDVEALLTDYNADNHIIYLYKDDIIGLTENVESFHLPIQQYPFGIYNIRHMFDSNTTLVARCRGILDENRIRHNIEWDISHNGHVAMADYIKKMVLENVDGAERLILDALDMSINEELYIWGAGWLGIPLTYYLINRSVRVKGIIDNNHADIDEAINSNEELQKTIHNGLWSVPTNYMDIDILPFNAIEPGAKIFIAIFLPNRCCEIMEQIESSRGNYSVVTYGNLYEEGLDI